MLLNIKVKPQVLLPIKRCKLLYDNVVIYILNLHTYHYSSCYNSTIIPITGGQYLLHNLIENHTVIPHQNK